MYFLVFGLLFDANRCLDYLAYLVIGVLTFSLISQATTTAVRCEPDLSADRCTSHGVIPVTSGIGSIYVFLPGVAIMVVLSPSGNWPSLMAMADRAWIDPGLDLRTRFATARIGRAWPDLHALLPHVVRLLFYLSGTLFDPAVLTDDKLVLRLFE